MTDEELQAVISALQKVRRHPQAEGYADQNLRDRMRGAHLLAMRLAGVPWPVKGEVIQRE